MSFADMFKLHPRVSRDDVRAARKQLDKALRHHAEAYDTLIRAVTDKLRDEDDPGLEHARIPRFKNGNGNGSGHNW